MNHNRTAKIRSAWPTLHVRIARRKKWTWIAIFKPAEPHSPSTWAACFKTIATVCTHLTTFLSTHFSELLSKINNYVIFPVMSLFQRLKLLMTCLSHFRLKTQKPYCWIYYLCHPSQKPMSKDIERRRAVQHHIPVLITDRIVYLNCVEKTLILSQWKPKYNPIPSSSAFNHCHLGAL